MKKIYLLSGIALAAFMLTPQTIKADCDFTPNALPGQAEDRTELTVDATVAVGEYGMSSMRYGSMENLASSKEEVVALFRGMSVYFIAAGTADVTYTEKVFIDRTNYCTTDHTIHYTVEKGSPTAYFAGQDAAALTTYNLTLSSGGGGDAGGAGGVTTGGDGSTGEGGGSLSYWTPSLVMKIKTFNADRGAFVEQAVTSGIKYSSSNPAVAEINESTGAVTVKGIVGSTVISATWDGDDNWKETTVSYTLVAKKAASIWFNPQYTTDTVGNVLKLTPNHTEGITIDAWESSRPEVATVDKDGNVTMLHFGTTNIDAIFNGNDQYHATRGRFQLIVSKKKPHIAFAQTHVQLDPQDSPALPALVKPEDISIDASKYTWRSTNTSVMTINQNTGAWEIQNNHGYTQIQCFFAGDDNYLPDTARCDVEIITSGITIAGEYVKASKPDIFGDGSAVYSIEPGSGNKILTLNKAEFDANGGVFIQSSDFLSIKVQGNCHIKNAQKAIQSSSAVFVWCENRKDTITIEATHTAISAQEAKIHDCYLFAEGGQYGLDAGNCITVSAGGYVFATGATEAIKARNFIKGENAKGGIEILTRGVSFTPYNGKNDYGFFGPGSGKATFVELGKVPLPVNNTEVKEIGFDGDGKNPDENLDVVFSGSNKDGFNDIDKQIEINTTTTDEQVTAALTLHVACSSDFLKALPGVLVFDVPTGEGKFEIECEIAAGFHAEAFIEGVGEAKVDAPKDGWIAVTYKVDKQTHVIIYLQENGADPAPARYAKANKNAAPGMAIKGIKITPKNAPTAFEDVNADADAKAAKMLFNGQVYIIRDGKTYIITGQEIR